ncbi:cation:dicarboxylase symporter family transporter [Novacetimonas hansenii]|uniref:cation:dicarboxylate symporter family transporter n=1 Tax=Novacetimonas hansenii TaxID=436 RepID=UPI00177ABEE5|nr:cation:dicarboxylase symporter family transporter [Novacetimonas hansenii]QOF94429.1 cation:dicarboxylase symporter family transporter [Novacetimonas hansenii]
MNTAPLSPTGTAHRTWRPGMFWQVVIGSVLGLGLGVIHPALAMQTRWVTDIFLRLIVMAVGPLLFCIVTMGIVGAGSLRNVGRLGAKALLYFEGMTTFVLLGSVGVAMLLHPGRAIVFTPTDEDTRMVASYAHNASLLHDGGITGFIVSLVPHSPADAFAQANILQILFFAILFGCCLSLIGPAGTPLVHLLEALSTLFSRMMRVIISLAPLGVFGAMATTTARYGINAIMHLAAFVGLYYLVIIVFLTVVLGGCLRMAGVRPLRFARYFREELAITFTTTTSDAVLPSVMAKLERLGVSSQVVGIVVPAGYSFNLDALSIYLGLAVIFLAQATGTHLSFWQMAIMLTAALFTSKGAHGVPGIAIVVLAATLQAMPSIPLASLTMLLAVDWFIGIARAVGNLAGNCVAPVIIGAWEGKLDREKMARELG